MKSSIDSKTEEAFYYAVNFYSTNDRSIEKQRFCLEQLMKITGFDAEACCKIQTPVMDVFMMGELMQIGSEIAQQHLTTITHNIRQHLLAVQSTLQPTKVSELPHIPTLGGSSSTSKNRDIDGLNIQIKNIVQDVTINGYMGQKALVMSNYDLEPHDMNYLSATMPSHSYNFSLVDFSNNPRIGPVGLDYTLKGAPGILSIQSGITDLSSMYQGVLTRSSFNIVKLDLSNCNIGDVGADILGHALVSRKLPATKHIDVSDNGITTTGYDNLMTALESPKVKSMMVTLVRNTVDLNQTVDQAMRSTIDFVTKGLRYAVEQHNQGLQGTKWDGSTVRTDDLDKWKNCKEVSSNVQKGIIGGLIKCMPLAEVPPSMFACIGQQAGLELLDPDTLWCAVEINEFVEEKSSDLIGDCLIC